MKTKWKSGLCCVLNPQATCPKTGTPICTECIQATKDSDWAKDRTISKHFYRRVLKCCICPRLHGWDTKNGF